MTKEIKEKNLHRVIGGGSRATPGGPQFGAGKAVANPSKSEPTAEEIS